MPHVEFTPHLSRHVLVKPFEAKGGSLHEVFAEIFKRYPQVRDYIVDEQGCIRKHVAVFVDGELITDRRHQKISLSPKSRVYIMQALSGG